MKGNLIIILLSFLILSYFVLRISEYEHHEIVVVGAGSAGTHTALKLSPEYGSKVALYESTDRIGGRDYDIRIKGVKGIQPEGAMRLLPSHTLVQQMCKELGLEIIPFKEHDQIVFLRGDTDRKNFKLTPEESTMSTVEMISLVTNGVLKANGITKSVNSRKEMTALVKTLKYKNTPLHMWNWSDLCSNFLSYEAIDYMKVRGGYWSVYAINNAAITMVQSMSEKSIFHTSGDNDKILAVKLGMMSVPDAMGRKFQVLGGKIHMEHKLTRVEKRGRITYLTFSTPVGNKIVSCDKVVLTVPMKVLVLLNFVGYSDQKIQQLRKSMSILNPYHATKIFLVYDHPWWTKEMDNGRSVTDLPIQQCFYWSTNPDNGKSVVMIYSDFYHSHQFSLVEDQKNLVESITHQLSILHNKTIPLPVDVAVKDWSEAWDFWGPGNCWEAMQTIQNPLDNVYVCGVGYSSNQGWMEGALETSQKVLDDHF
jgi:monoamine oxidase